MKKFALLSLIVLAACNGDSYEVQYDDGVKKIGEKRLGSAADQWIEMHNSYGEWERTGLIFGYADDREECLKAIAGLKKVNFQREYRCTAAN